MAPVVVTGGVVAVALVSGVVAGVAAEELDDFLPSKISLITCPILVLGSFSDDDEADVPVAGGVAVVSVAGGVVVAVAVDVAFVELSVADEEDELDEVLDPP